MNDRNNIAMIEVVAKGLGALRKDFVFIGGATVSFYLKGTSPTEIRPTDDVDCIVEISSHKDYHTLQATLEKAGFSHSMKEKAPICRMTYRGISVDIMPTDSKILGFSNIWYSEGINHAIETILPNGVKIQILSLPYFIAAKIDAYFGRGHGDFRLSADIEDVVTILDGQKDFSALLKAPTSVRTYLKKNFQLFVNDSLFLEALFSHLSPGSDQRKRAEHILDSLNKFCVAT